MILVITAWTARRTGDAIERTQEALRESEERHRTILQTAMDGFWLVDTQGRLLEVNEAYCRMSGYSAQELLAMRISDLEADETADDTAARIQKIMAQGEDRFESRHRRKDGSIFDVEVSVQYRPAEGGRFVAFLRDITERKRAEKALRESEERFRRIFSHAGEGIGSVDDGERFQFANPAAETIFGVPAGGLVGRSLIEFLSSEESRHVLEESANRRVGLESSYEMEILRADGVARQLLVTAVPDISAQGRFTGALGVFRDITERKQAEEALRESEARFDQLAAQSGTIAWEVDAQGLYTYVSHVSEAVWGYRPDELVGRMHFYDLHPEAGREAFKTAAFAVFERKEPFQNLVNAVRDQGWPPGVGLHQRHPPAERRRNPAGLPRQRHRHHRAQADGGGVTSERAASVRIAERCPCRQLELGCGKGLKRVAVVARNVPSARSFAGYLCPVRRDASESDPPGRSGLHARMARRLSGRESSARAGVSRLPARRRRTLSLRSAEVWFGTRRTNRSA